jgi:predicted transcriptional regulator
MTQEKSEIVEELLAAAMESNEVFIGKLRAAMRQLRISTRELSEGSGVPLSTINKIFSEGRDLRCSTMREILKYLRSHIDFNAEIVIGIIATRPSLDNISKHQLLVKGKKVFLKEYPASSIEDVIMNGVKAERDRVNGLVCASIVANVIEKFVRVPIMSIKVEEPNVLDAVSLLVDKISTE